MELTLAHLLLLIIIITTAASKKLKFKSKSKSINMIPGPKNLPIIGSMHHLAGRSLPHRKLRDLAMRHGPVMLLRLGLVDLVVVSSREAAEDVMRAHDPAFASRPELAVPRTLSYGCTNIAFSPYGKNWMRLKKICVSELLSANRVRSFSSLIEEEVSSLVREIFSISRASSTTINLSVKCRELFNTVISRGAFGKKCRRQHQKRFIAVMKEALQLVTGFCVADLFPTLGFIDVASGMRFKLERIHREFDEILEEIIRDHQDKKNKEEAEGEEEDLVDVLLRVKERGDLETPLTIDNIKAVILDMFVGGTESSSVLVEWAMAELMRHPETMATAQDEVRRVLLKGYTQAEEMNELRFLNLVIKETFRLHLPAPLIPRACRESCTVQGYTIQSGTRVTINAWALGRDPRYWGDDTESFRPERFNLSSVDLKGANFEFLPFGAGRRICPGITYASTNIQLALARLLLCFDWQLPDGMKPEDLDMTETFAANTCRKEDLYLVATPYAGAHI